LARDHGYDSKAFSDEVRENGVHLESSIVSTPRSITPTTPE